MCPYSPVENSYGQRLRRTHCPYATGPATQIVFTRLKCLSKPSFAVHSTISFQNVPVTFHLFLFIGLVRRPLRRSSGHMNTAQICDFMEESMLAIRSSWHEDEIMKFAPFCYVDQFWPILKCMTLELAFGTVHPEHVSALGSTRKELVVLSPRGSHLLRNRAVMASETSTPASGLSEPCICLWHILMYMH